MKKRALVLFDAAFGDVVTRHKKGHKLAKLKVAAKMGDAPHVVAALTQAGFAATSAAITSDPARILAAIRKAKPHVVMNLCDTLDGVGAKALLVPALLESLGVPFAGASTSALALSKRKHDVKAVLSREAVPTPRYQVVHDARDLEALALRIEPPVIVKLSGEHASIGLEQASVCFDLDETQARCRSMLQKFGQALLLEEYVDGRELSVSFYGDGPALRALPPMELPFDDVPEGFLRLRTFDKKWTDTAGFDDAGKARARRSDTRNSPIPIRRPTVDVGWQLENIVDACARAFRAVGCRDWGRVDVRIDKGGVPLIIDVTPNTFLGPTGPCAKAAAAAGLAYHAYVAAIVDGALGRVIS